MDKNWYVFEKVVKTEVTRILLTGAVGIGKTTAACNAGEHYQVTLHEESSVAELIGHWIPKGNEFQWHDGVGVRAWKEGKILVINEIDKASGAVLTILHALLDDPEIAHLTIPSGETIRPKKGFKAIATMNGQVEDLPIALADRFDIKLEVKSPHPRALEKLTIRLRNLVEASYKNPDPPITFRQVLAYQKLSNVLGEEEALEVVFGDRAESVKEVLIIGQREVKDE